MLELRKSEERGTTRAGWLESRHSFSFGHYRDRRHPGFRSLRVVNEDWIAPGQGFDWHGHRDMEILTFLLDGELEHQDDTGAHSVLRPGRLQLMTAGTGVQHREFNSSENDTTHLIQIWIDTDAAGHAPRYQERSFRTEEEGLTLLASPGGGSESLELNQDASVERLRLASGRRVRRVMNPNRYAWVQLCRGAADLNGVRVAEGDGVALSDVTTLGFRAKSDLEALVFDLA